MDPPETQAPENNTANQSATVNLLQQIVDVLQASTIAEERGKDVRSKFWAAYKKVSTEYDDSMLERCRSNMDILLTFAGLFSGVNTAFIMAMQPNPLDTTNALLVLLIQVALHGPSAAQSTTLSSSTNYSSIFWMQTLAYMSLTLSLLAAFGAVMGKQWLNFYKTRSYGGGTLEERCKQRHDRYEGLEIWWFEGMLQTFSDLLKASLFLFGVSLAGWMWTLQRTISILIISMTAFGFACYVVAILASVIYPKCPFQTRLSLVIRRAIFYPNPQPKEQPQEDSTVSAMDWMLKTSTYPDTVKAALDLLSVMPFRSNAVKVKSLCESVLHMFEDCFSLEGNPISEDARAYGAALINFSMKYSQAMDVLRDTTRGWGFWKLWHTVYLSQAVGTCQKLYGQMTPDVSDPWLLKQNIRTAMCMVVPDDIEWIWGTEFKQGHDQQKADLFKGITKRFIRDKEFDAAGDAFILLTGFKDLSPSDLIPFLKDGSSHGGKLLHGALHGARTAFNSPAITCDSTFRNAVLMAICPTNDKDNQFTDPKQLLDFTEWPKTHRLAGSPLPDIQRMLLLVLRTPFLSNPAEYILFCDILMQYLHSNKPRDSKRVALRRACRLRHDLAKIEDEGVDPNIRNMVLSKLYPALRNVVRADWFDRNDYLRLIFVLASSPAWLPRLSNNGHITWCINIIPELQKSPDPYSFYPAGILLRIQLLHQEQAAPQLSAITSDEWWKMMKMAWHAARYDYPPVLADIVEIFEALVRGTETYMPYDKSELQYFLGDLDRANDQLGGQKLRTGEKAKYAVERLKREVYRRLQAPSPGPVLVGQSFEPAG